MKVARIFKVTVELSVEYEDSSYQECVRGIGQRLPYELNSAILNGNYNAEILQEFILEDEEES